MSTEHTATPRLLTANALAKMLGASVTTLWRWRQHPDFPKPRRMPSGAIRFVESEITDYLGTLPAADRQ